MLNMAIALALITYWGSYYFSLPATGILEFGVALIPLAVLAGAMLVWPLILLKTPAANKLFHNRFLLRILFFSNIWALCTIGLHTYNSLNHSTGTSVEEIMAGMYRFSEICESYFRAFYPFSKILIIFCVTANTFHIYKYFRASKRGDVAALPMK
jgi:hypothetical protein